MEKTGKFRKKAREILFRVLYSYDLKGGDIFEIVEEQIKEIRNKLSPEVIEYAYSIAKGITDSIEDIDRIISENLKEWRLERLGYPERALLRLGTYELVFSDIQDKGRVFVDILDLAKCYIDNEDTLKFINGVLSTIHKKYNKQDVKV
ncbi:NusB antitermination factor [Persephonella hydrogeniphila]|uniref:Transcription antitermination protein NusB n=1 Tax=Persephonella hydrogeniphila TaxID=198703 RepID=A0A285NC88_9AQUI|nr:transcription antitermination factor NusB [Persephonella hydrogeniphila]SNZ07124.1 NusB antitermination factor [Persephonella hydrogeniphila]